MELSAIARTSRRKVTSVEYARDVLGRGYRCIGRAIERKNESLHHRHPSVPELGFRIDDKLSFDAIADG